MAEEINLMNATNKTALVIAFVVVVVLPSLLRLGDNRSNDERRHDGERDDGRYQLEVDTHLAYPRHRHSTRLGHLQTKK